MPEIPPNKHGVLQIMMLRLDAAYSQNERLTRFCVKSLLKNTSNVVHFGQGTLFICRYQVCEFWFIPSQVLSSLAVSFVSCLLVFAELLPAYCHRMNIFDVKKLLEL